MGIKNIDELKPDPEDQYACSIEEQRISNEVVLSLFEAAINDTDAIRVFLLSLQRKSITFTQKGEI